MKKENKISNAVISTPKGYVACAGSDFTEAMSTYNEAISEFTSARHSRGPGFDTRDIGGNGVSGRYGMTNYDYEAWRPGEKSLFKDVKEAILHAEECYKRNGLIKNVIDIMGDFASHGIRLVHPNKRIEKFFQNWFRRVNGVERSERFLNNLYRLGNVVVRSQTAIIKPNVKEEMYRAKATPDMDIKEIDVNNNEIPMKFTFLHPALVDVQGGALSNFVSSPQYFITMPKHLMSPVSNPNTEESQVLSQLPSDIREALNKNLSIPLPKEKTEVYHYKKDDWQDWAWPIISSIAIDISIYDKLKLADRSALDGAIRNIRIFTLGDIENKIFPGPEAISTLADLLGSDTGNGTLDLIWGPDIKLIESSSQVYKFLGQEKYEPTLMAIYAGLGIPPTLTGTFGASGTTNNFISLKTLTQRLEYGRDVLVSFWDKQIRIVQKAMGFRFPARVEFDLMNLGDEVAEKALLVQLSDRNLISDELLQKYFGSDPEMERIRNNAENRERSRNSRPEKAGPFYKTQTDHELKKLALQGGTVTPSQVGLELDDKKTGEVPALKMRQPPGAGNKTGPKTTKKKGVPGQGRPKNSKDSQKRKDKTFKPKTKAAGLVWASEAQSFVADIINEATLKTFGKKNIRSLSQKEYGLCEEAKLLTFCNIEPFSKLSKESVLASLKKNDDGGILKAYRLYEDEAYNELDRELLSQEKKQLQLNFYYELKMDNNNG